MNPYKIIILGAGPAGLTAAIYAARANLSPLVLEGPKPGGQLMGTTAIENWPGNTSILGPQLMLNMIQQAKDVGVTFLQESASEIEVSSNPFVITTNEKTKLQAQSLIIATGSTPNRLNCPGEDVYWGKGVSTCATCDGAFYRDRPVVILGGGDAGMENASFLAKYTKKITLIHIGEKLSASHTMQQRILKNPDIKIIYSSTITEIEGNGDHISSVTIQNQKTQSIEKLATDGLFLSIGAKPNTSFFKNNIALSSFGHIAVTDNVKSSIPGIFAAGDVHDFKYRQAIVSAGFGCMAALEAERFLNSLDT